MSFGQGTFKAPTLTKYDLLEIEKRATSINDQQIKTDLFRLIAALKSKANDTIHRSETVSK